MSVLWFICCTIGWANNLDITDMNFMMIALFYIGDCILITRKS